MTKYHATKTTVAGIEFDSKAESRRYADLLLLERAGKIKDLRRQVPYIIAPGVKLHGEKRARPAVRYICDFVYTALPSGVVIVEDVKGMDTPLSRLKRHLMATVLGVQVRIT